MKTSLTGAGLALARRRAIIERRWAKMPPGGAFDERLTPFSNRRCTLRAFATADPSGGARAGTGGFLLSGAVLEDGA